MRSHRSGQLGEAICKELFDISEPAYEIKSSGARNQLVVLQICQLLEQMEKQYVIVRYTRRTRTLKRGPRKGTAVFDETVEEGYQNNKLKIAVVRGWRLVEFAVREKLAPYCAGPGGSVYIAGKWGGYWRMPIRCLPFDDAYIVEDTDRYTLYAFDDDPPAWMGDAVARTVQHGLFAEPGRNGRKPKGPVRQEELEDDDPVPF